MRRKLFSQNISPSEILLEASDTLSNKVFEARSKTFSKLIGKCRHIKQILLKRSFDCFIKAQPRGRKCRGCKLREQISKAKEQKRQQINEKESILLKGCTTEVFQNYEQKTP